MRIIVRNVTAWALWVIVSFLLGWVLIGLIPDPAGLFWPDDPAFAAQNAALVGMAWRLFSGAAIFILGAGARVLVVESSRLSLRQSAD